MKTRLTVEDGKEEEDRSSEEKSAPHVVLEVIGSGMTQFLHLQLEV